MVVSPFYPPGRARADPRQPPGGGSAGARTRATLVADLSTVRGRAALRLGDRQLVVLEQASEPVPRAGLRAELRERRDRRGRPVAEKCARLRVWFQRRVILLF